MSDYDYWKLGDLYPKTEKKFLKVSCENCWYIRNIVVKYEWNEMLPSIKAAQSIANLVDTTVGYLLGETEQINILKDPSMLQRLNEINNLPDDDRHCIIYAIDGLIQNVRSKMAFAE